MKQNPHTLKFVSCLLLMLVFGSCSTGEKKESAESSERSIVALAPRDFQSKLSSDSDAVLVDVRTPPELSEGMIKGAVNIDFKDVAFTEKIKKLDKDKPYYVYCLSGKRSSDAAKQMESAGFKKVYTLKGGYEEWNAEGLETVHP